MTKILRTCRAMIFRVPLALYALSHVDQRAYIDARGLHIVEVSVPTERNLVQKKQK